MIGLAVALPLAVTAGCDATEVRPLEPVDTAAVVRGRAAAERLGCGACHSLPGIAWPASRVGPPLDDYARRALIAGRLPNRADTLARFVRNAPALVPGTGVPAIPMSDRDAADIAAYLHGAE